MPYASTHAARQIDPSVFEQGSFRTMSNDLPEGITFIIGKLKDETYTRVQSIRFEASKWTAAEAKSWLKKHNFKTDAFEEASKAKEA